MLKTTKIEGSWVGGLLVKCRKPGPNYTFGFLKSCVWISQIQFEPPTATQTAQVTAF